MNFFRKIFDHVAFWIKLGSFKSFNKIILIPETSKKIDKSRNLFLAGPKNQPKWLEFYCPSGCGEVIYLNLMKSHMPHWSIEQNKGDTITVSPSIISETCRSHFFIRANKVEWV